MKTLYLCSALVLLGSTALAQGLPQQPAGIGERGSGQTQSTMDRTVGPQRQSSETPANKEAATRNMDSPVPKGIIGVSLRMSAERIGDSALLYIAQVHPEGPAQQAGLKHGDEVVSVNGETVMGKTYEQVISMMRGEAGTEVKLGVKRGAELRELPITRVPDDKLYKG